jgi:hypothetical protein
MKKASRLILAAALLALGFFAWRILFPSPEKVIRSRLNELAKAASFPAKEGELATPLNAQKFASFFTADVEISVDVRGHSRQIITGREQLFQDAMGARQFVRGLNVEFFDIVVAVGPGKKSAVANLTAKWRVPGEDFTIQELKFYLVEVGRDWLVNGVETVKTLE